jgi:fucose 4-O-acetylase-like acetyltransferase
VPDRDAYFDNAKVAAITLVVAAHAWAPLTPHHHAVQAAYLFVFTFHMPAFIFIAGYFTRSWDGQPRRVRRLITRVLVPYLIFETAYTVFFDTAGGRDGSLSLLDPWWATWFVLALFIWRLSAPVWRVLRWPVPFAVAVSLTAALGELGPALDLDRVLQLLPFFVLGLTIRREHLELLHRPAARIAAVAVLVAALGVAFAAAGHGLTEFFFWRSGRGAFDELSFGRWLSLRVLVLGCAVAATAAFLALVPRRRMRLTALGEGTMYAYLLHGFVVKGAVFAGAYEHLRSPAGFAAVTVASAGLALVLCSRTVRRAFRWAVEPELRWAFRDHDARALPELELEPPDRQRSLLGSAASL